MKIGIKNATLISMSEKREKIEKNIDIIIEEGKIKKIGKNIVRIAENIKTLDAQGRIVMPGLINTHAHIPMSIFRETLDGYNLQDWLTKKIWPMEEKLTNEDIYNASMLTFLEMIKTGCTTINDMYFMPEEIIKAQQKAGIRMQITRTIIGDGAKKQDLEKLEELKKLITKYNNKYNNLSFNIGIHGLYTTNLEYIRKAIKYAKEKEILVNMHFCENTQEVQDIINLYNKKPIEIIEEEFKDVNLLLAHCIELTNEDIERLAKIKESVSISHCPISNLKLGCGIANVNKMLEKGLNVSLGTDGQGSGSNLDLFETMKFTALLQKGEHKNSKQMEAYEVIKMATINGAKALGLENKIGSIEEGKDADLILINMDSVLTKPENNLIAQIVYNVKGTDVDSVIVNGNVLMEDKKMLNLDEKEICNNADKICNSELL